MSSGTVVVVGAGPGFGLSIGRRFGKAGYRVALIARRQSALDELVATLAGEGIEAEAFLADAGDSKALRAALESIKARFGSIDVLQFSPLPGPQDDAEYFAATKLNEATINRLHNLIVAGAVNCVQTVLPDMLARGSGSILLTTSGSAHHIMPVYTPVGMVMAALRSYALCLNEELSGRGVFVGTMCISVLIRPGDADGDPDLLADRYFQMHSSHQPAELIVTSGVDPNQLHDRDMEERGVDWQRPELEKH